MKLFQVFELDITQRSWFKQSLMQRGFSSAHVKAHSSSPLAA